MCLDVSWVPQPICVFCQPWSWPHTIFYVPSNISRDLGMLNPEFQFLLCSFHIILPDWMIFWLLHFPRCHHMKALCEGDCIKSRPLGRGTSENSTLNSLNLNSRCPCSSKSCKHFHPWDTCSGSLFSQVFPPIMLTDLSTMSSLPRPPSLCPRFGFLWLRRDLIIVKYNDKSNRSALNHIQMKPSSDFRGFSTIDNYNLLL